MNISFKKTGAIACLVIVFFCCKTDRIQPITHFDYDEIRNLKLKGVVTDVETPTFPAFHGFGVIYLDLIQSNISYYDPRYKKKYLIIIKQKKAELYQSTGGVSLGDTIDIDIPELKISFYSKVWDEKVNFIPKIYDKSFYNYIKEEKLQKI